MNRSPDLILMLFGLFRVALWVFVAAEAWRLRKILPFASRLTMCGASLLAVNAIVFSLFNAHYAVPHWLVDTAVISSTPGVAATSVGLVLIFRYIVGLRRRLEAGLPEPVID